MPSSRPLAKKRERAREGAHGAVVEAVDPDLSQLLGQAAGTDVLDEGGVVGEKVVGGVVDTLAHVPAETQALRLDPLVRNPLVRSGVLGGGGFAGGGESGKTRAAGVRLGGGGEVREEASPVLSALQILLQKVPIVPLELAVLPGAEGHVGDPEDLVPLGGEGHLEEGVGEEEFAGELGVEPVRGALREDLGDHAAGKLDLVHGPVFLGVHLAAGHWIEALVGPLHHALNHAGAGAVFPGRHVPGEFGNVQRLAVALD